MQMCCWIVDLTYSILWLIMARSVYYEVLLKSGNYIVYLLKWTSDLDFKKGGCVKQIRAD